MPIPEKSLADFALFILFEEVNESGNLESFIIVLSIFLFFLRIFLPLSRHVSFRYLLGYSKKI